MGLVGGVAAVGAGAEGDAARLAALLAADPSHANATDEAGRSVLQRAAAEGHVEVVQLLLHHGAHPDSRDHVYGNTAMHEAAWKGYSQTVRALARGGADLRALNHAGFTALHFACQNGHNQSCRELLLAGAPPDTQNTYGDTALHTAARYGHAGVARILVSAACGVSCTNRNGDTALHIAAAMGRRKLTRILLEAGADPLLRNHQRETPRDIAQRKGLQHILDILDAPRPRKHKNKRDKSKERALDDTDAPTKRDRANDKKKKNVHFEPAPVQVAWSPYGCHYYPDPECFPKPRLDSLPPEPLQKGEQYYLDLAGNIKKGPVGAGYACYCAPFFKHMEEKLEEGCRDLKRHMERAHERLDRRVAHLEERTQGHVSELTRALAAERARCDQRHQHLQQWVARGALHRASERTRRLARSPRGGLDIPPLQRTRSLELLDTDQWRRVHTIINTFNRNCERFESTGGELGATRGTSRSNDTLERTSPSPRRARTTDGLDSPPERHQNVTAEIHVNANKVSVCQPPGAVEVADFGPRYPSARHTVTTPPAGPPPPVTARPEDPPPLWRSRVLQRTSDDIKKRIDLDKEKSNVPTRADEKSLDISHDGYVRLRKHQTEDVVARESRKSVQELVAQVERAQSPEPPPAPRKGPPPERAEGPPPPPPPSILKMSQQPLRPAPILKEKPPKSKRFSLHNLIPFPTRKTFQSPTKEDGNHSESSDEEDTPIRSTAQPGPAGASLLQTLPLPNYEAVSSECPARPLYPHDYRPMPPKDAYFHEIPNRQMPYRELESVASQYPCPLEYRTGARSRQPLCQPRRYTDRLEPGTELEIAGQEEVPLHARLHALAINTHLPETHTDRDSHNDSGYSTKVYGSSQGPSPSLSAHEPHTLHNGKHIGHMGTSSLV